MDCFVLKSITFGYSIAYFKQFTTVIFSRFAPAMAPNAVSVSQPTNGPIGNPAMSVSGVGVARSVTPAMVQPQHAASAGHSIGISHNPTVATAQVLIANFYAFCKRISIGPFDDLLRLFFKSNDNVTYRFVAKFRFILLL